VIYEAAMLFANLYVTIIFGSFLLSKDFLIFFFILNIFVFYLFPVGVVTDIFFKRSFVSDWRNHYIFICNFVKRFFDFLFYLKYFCFLLISRRSSYWYFFQKKFCFSWLSNIIQIFKKVKKKVNLYTVVLYLLYILLYYINNIYYILYI